MVTYYNKKDLVAFGNYLLSDKRKELILEHPDFSEDSQDFRLKQVSHADFENFFNKKTVRVELNSIEFVRRQELDRKKIDKEI